MKWQRNDGFSLTEIIVAVGLLGIMGIFAISKLIANQQNQQSKAIFKETDSALNSILYDGLSSGSVTQSTAIQYVLNNINAVKICSTTMIAGGCRTKSMAWSLEQFDQGFVLANGATVAVQLDQTQPSLYVNFLVDWNGDNLPNTLGQDEIYLIGVYTAGGGAGQYATPGNTFAWNDGGTNIALWNSYFQ